MKVTVMGFNTYAFEKLEVWKLSRKYAVAIYKLSKSFPAEEKFGLVSQIRRAAISVSSNLAEGSARISPKEPRRNVRDRQARFTEIAYGSLLETLSQLILASDLEFISEQEVNSLRPLIDQKSRMLNALRSSQFKRSK